MTPQTNAKVFQKLVLPTMVSNRINQNQYNSLNKQFSSVVICCTGAKNAAAQRPFIPTCITPSTVWLVPILPSH